MTQLFNDVKITGVADVPQLTILANATQVTNPIQVWQDSAGNPLLRVSGDGRLQIGNNIALGSADALINANYNPSGAQPTSAWHAAGVLNVPTSLAGTVNWVYHELQLTGAGTVNGVQSGLYAKLTNSTTGNAGTADLRAATFQAISSGGGTALPVGKATGVRAIASNAVTGGSAYLSQAIGVEATISNDVGGSITAATAFSVVAPSNGGTIGTLYGLKMPDLTQGSANYALYTGQGIVHVGDVFETPVLASMPASTPSVNFVQLYTKLLMGAPQLYAKNNSGTEYLVGGGAPMTSKYLVQVADASLPNAQAMGALSTGLVKNTTTTGVQSIAVAGTDYSTPAGTENLSNKTISASTISASTIDNSVIGATTPTAITGTTIKANGILTTGSGRVIAERVVTAAGAVTVATTDYMVTVNKTTGAPTAINLPAIPTTGQTFVIHDGKGDAATNNITITPAAGNVNGVATLVLNTAYATVTVTYNGTQWDAQTGGSNKAISGATIDNSIIGGTTPVAITGTTINATGILTTGSGQVVTERVVTAAGDVTVAATDYMVTINKTTGEYTNVYLPTSPTTGQTFVIHDGKGDAGTNSIFINPGSKHINGNEGFALSTAYASATVIYNGTQWDAQVDGNNASMTSKYLLQVADASLPNAQAMGALSTGLVKNTTTTGVQSIAAAGTDYTSPTGTENLSNKTISASTVDNSIIGGTTPAAVTGTTVKAIGILTTTSGQVVTERVVTAAGDVTVAATDYMVTVNKTTGAPTTINLPASPTTGQTFVIHDGKGDAGTNNITISPAAGNINGVASLVLNTAYASATVTYNGTQWDAQIGGSGALTTSQYLLQVADASLPNAQVMGALSTGLVKNTTATGVQSIATAGTDYTTPTGTENLSNKTISTSTIDNSAIGSTTPLTGAFTSVNINQPSAAARLHIKDGSAPQVIVESTSAVSTWLELRDGAGTQHRWALVSGLNTQTDGWFALYDPVQAKARFVVTQAGLVGINTLMAVPGAQLEVDASTATTTGVVVRGASSQSANLQEWQDNSASVLTSVSGAGLLTTASVKITTGAGTGKFLKSDSAGLGAWNLLSTADIATALTTPGPIGSTTPSTGAFTTLKATTGAGPGKFLKSDPAGLGTWNLLSTADIATALTAPGPIGGTTPSTGAFTTLKATTGAGPGKFLQSDGSGNGTWQTAVTSVALTVPSFLSVSGSPVTTSGTLAVSLATQSANLIFAGPASGGAVAPTFRALVAADLTSVLASPPAIGSTAAAAGTFTTLTGTTSVGATLSDTGTNNVTNIGLLTHNSSGAVAAGLGAGLLFAAQSSTTAARSQGRVRTQWVTATDASRTAKLVLSAFDTAERDGLAVQASGSAAMIGFLGVTPAIQQTGGVKTAAATYGSNEQTMLQTAYNALRTFGLLS